MLGEDAAQIVHAGRLALGARERADLGPCGRMIIGGVRKKAEGAADIAHEHAGGIHAVIDGRNVGDGAGAAGINKVLALERRALADKERPRDRLARIVRRATDLQLTCALRCLQQIAVLRKDRKIVLERIRLLDGGGHAHSLMSAIRFGHSHQVYSKGAWRAPIRTGRGAAGTARRADSRARMRTVGKPHRKTAGTRGVGIS